MSSLNKEQTLLKSWANNVLEVDTSDAFTSLVNAEIRQALRNVFKSDPSTPFESAAQRASDSVITKMAIAGGMHRDALGSYMKNMGANGLYNSAEQYAPGVQSEFKSHMGENPVAKVGEASHASVTRGPHKA